MTIEEKEVWPLVCKRDRCRRGPLPEEDCCTNQPVPSSNGLSRKALQAVQIKDRLLLLLQHSFPL